MRRTLLAAFVVVLASISSASAATLTVVHSFCAEAKCVDGSSPRGDVFIDSTGTLYGTAVAGGTHNGGAIYRLRFIGGTWRYDTIYNFCAKPGCADGNGPLGRLIVDKSGNLYGVTGGGGNGGIAYELIPKNGQWALKTLYRFCAEAGCKDGAWPSSGLSYKGAESGAPYDGVSPLYGETQFGGHPNLGVAYELQTIAGKSLRSETVLHAFCSETVDCDTTDGSYPIGGFLVGQDGALLGISAAGGVNFDGTIFRLTPRDSGKWKESILYTFCGCADGQQPQGFISDDAGGLYGATLGQGANGEGGTLFRFDAQGTFTVLHAFCSARNCADGHQPDAPPTLDSAGNLYGTTAIGGGNGGDFHLGSGVVYRLSAGGDFTVLHAFCSEAKCRDGQTPETSLTIEANGRLIGTTLQGGKFGGGVVFELAP